ncbi:polyphosphate polymerase domain-containing protein [bacterium]|nr:polyphosphate polymerase domain-containing protein [bacterium]
MNHPSPIPNVRYERKFIAQAHSLSAVLAVVRRHPAMFREAYPQRVVNNIYLDTPGLRAYFEHVSGVADRVKTRIRWYGDLEGPIDTPTLERKIKRGLVGGKLSYPLSSITDIESLFACHDSRSTIHDSRLAIREILSGMRATLVNRYSRHYFLSGDGRFRLTVDSRIQFFSPGASFNPSAPILPRAVPIVIELKFAPEHALDAARITNLLPFRLGRCSKYVLGIQSLGPLASIRPIHLEPIAQPIPKPELIRIPVAQV